MPDPISRLEALRLLADAVVPRQAVARVPADAVGLAAARDIKAGCDVPETACSVRDGYALRSADVAEADPVRPVRLAVGQLIRAESENPAPLGPGQAARVLTGGTMPPGADCAVAEEDVEIGEGHIRVTAPARPGWFVRPEGGEIGAGAVIVPAGGEITTQAAAVMTRTRLETVPVYPRPTAICLALGSELAAPGEPCGARFPADNLVLASGLLEKAGAEVAGVAVVPDERSRLVAALSRPDLPNLVVTSGGTGRSERDFARAGARQSGFDILFDTVDMRPGRNVFAALRGRTLLFGLPGPPAAVFTCLHALIAPTVRAMRGLARREERLAARFTKGLNARPGSEWLVQCELAMDGATLTATPLAGKDVPPMFGMGRADGLAVLPGGVSLLPGDEAEILTIAPL